MKLAILYAGQGSQHPGMGKDLYERYPAFREAFNAADLDFDLESVCFDDPEGVLNLTQYTQPCMVAFACGVTAVLAEKGVKPTGTEAFARKALCQRIPCRSHQLGHEKAETDSIPQLLVKQVQSSLFAAGRQFFSVQPQHGGHAAVKPLMGKEFYEASPAFRAAFDSAALDFDLHRVCFEDPDGVLNQTEYPQPCMVAFACGVTAVLLSTTRIAFAPGRALRKWSAAETSTARM